MRRLVKGMPWWAGLLVLSVIGIRALVPAGFMLGPVAGHMSFVLCEPDVIGGHSHLHAGHVHPGVGDAPHHHEFHGDPACPYAQSAGPAPLPTLPVLPGGPVLVGLVLPTAFDQVFLQSGPTRQQFPRGPPHLA
jgi:hypothetical protein